MRHKPHFPCWKLHDLEINDHAPIFGRNVLIMFFSLGSHLSIYIYIYMCVCVLYNVIYIYIYVSIIYIYIYPADSSHWHFSSSPPALFIARLATGGDQTDDVVVVPEEQRSFRHLPGGGCLWIRWSDDPKQKPTSKTSWTMWEYKMIVAIFWISRGE